VAFIYFQNKEMDAVSDVEMMYLITKMLRITPGFEDTIAALEKDMVRRLYFVFSYAYHGLTSI
jgi:hypothetical protein